MFKKIHPQIHIKKWTEEKSAIVSWSSLCNNNVSKVKGIYHILFVIFEAKNKGNKLLGKCFHSSPHSK